MIRYLLVSAVVLAGCAEPEVHQDENVPAPQQIVDLGTVPEFIAESMNGRAVSSVEFEGKVLLVNFWATWCGPCHRETPALVELQNELEGDGLQVIGISMDATDTTAVREFMERYNVSYPMIHSPEELAEEFGGVFALPTTYLVARDGKIVSRVVGEFKRSEMDSSIRAEL